MNIFLYTYGIQRYHNVGKHSDVEAFMRHVLQMVYIREGRSSVKQFEKGCKQ